MTDLLEYAIKEVIERATIEDDKDGTWTIEALGVELNECSDEEDAIALLEDYIRDNCTWQQVAVALAEDYDLDGFADNSDDDYVCLRRN